MHHSSTHSRRRQRAHPFALKRHLEQPGGGRYHTGGTCTGTAVASLLIVAGSPSAAASSLVVDGAVVVASSLVVDSAVVVWVAVSLSIEISSSIAIIPLWCLRGEPGCVGVGEVSITGSIATNSVHVSASCRSVAVGEFKGTVGAVASLFGVPGSSIAVAEAGVFFLLING